MWRPSNLCCVRVKLMIFVQLPESSKEQECKQKWPTAALQTPRAKGYAIDANFDPYDAITTPASLFYHPRSRSATFHCVAFSVSEHTSTLWPML